MSSTRPTLVDQKLLRHLEGRKLIPRLGGQFACESREPRSQCCRSEDSFFLEFAKIVPSTFPKLILMVTGGIQNTGWNGGCVKLPRVWPNRHCSTCSSITQVTQANYLEYRRNPRRGGAVVFNPLHVPWLVQHMPVKMVGASMQS